MAPVNLYGTSGMLSCFFSWGLLALAPGVPKDRLSPTPPIGTTTANDSSISLLLSPLITAKTDTDADAEGVCKRMACT